MQRADVEHVQRMIANRNRDEREKTDEALEEVISKVKNLEIKVSAIQKLVESQKKTAVKPSYETRETSSTTKTKKKR